MSILQFPNEFFEPEVREGFYITGMVKRSWAVQLETLAQVDAICKRHGIKWFADCGTLIGAVRHNGFVPWDDDLDICMLRDDFLRFRDILATEMPEGYFIYDAYDELDVYQPLLRLVRGEEIRFDNDYLSQNFQFPYTAGLDIIPLDYKSENDEAEEMRKELIRLVNDASVLFNDLNPVTPQLEDLIQTIEEKCQVTLDRTKSIRRQLHAVQEQLYCMFPSSGAKSVVLMKYWIEQNNHVYPIELFDEVIPLPFEQFTVDAPARYDAVLRIEYGDYSRNVRSGGEHDYPFYGRQEAKLKAFLAEKNPFDYIFRLSDLDNPLRDARQAMPQAVQSFCTQLRGICDSMDSALAKGAAESVLSVLSSCQEQAIALGNQIEQTYGEGHEIVRKLEAFCEAIYQAYEVISVGADDAMPISVIRQSLDEINETIPLFHHTRKEMVFLPFAAKHWPAMEGMWRLAKEDPDCDVYVIPIPYFDKTLDGRAMAMHFDVDKYPDYVELTDYQTFDFVRHHPDVIVTQNPYDEYGDTISVHPDFYTRNLRQFTDKLIYIPYFMLDEISENDGRAKSTLRHFVPVPGVMLADEIIVQSEEMRKAYIEELVARAGEETRTIWEARIKGTGLPLQDVSSTQKDLQMLPDEWNEMLCREDGSLKKVILYTVSTSNLIEHPEKTLTKMQRVFETFAENKDAVVCIWRPHPQMEEILSAKPEILAAYEDLKNQFIQNQVGILDETTEITTAAELADAYYGDAGFALQKCLRRKLPIMVQNIDV